MKKNQGAIAFVLSVFFVCSSAADPLRHATVDSDASHPDTDRKSSLIHDDTNKGSVSEQEKHTTHAIHHRRKDKDNDPSTAVLEKKDHPTTSFRLRSQKKSGLGHTYAQTTHAWSLVWAQSIPYHPRSLLTLLPAATDSSLIVASSSGRVRAFSLARGRMLWRHRFPPLTAGVSISGDLFFVVSSDQMAYGVRVLDGHIVWKTPLSETVTALPLCDPKGRLLLRTLSGNVIALDSHSGDFLWRSSRFQPEELIVRDTGPLTFSDHRLWVPVNQGRLFVFDENGHFLSSIHFFSSQGWNEVDRLSDVLGPVFLPNERTLCAVSFGHAVGCYDHQKKMFSWVKKMRSVHAFSWDKSKIYVSRQDGIVESLDFSSGERAWVSPFLGADELTKPVVFGNHILVGDRWGRLNILNRQNGALVHRLSFSRHVSFFVEPIVVRSGVVLLSQDGHLFFVRYS